MRLTVVDTLSTIVFFTGVAAFSEYVIAGMDPDEVLATRLIMIPLMILTGRPYGLWRDWVFRRASPRTGLGRLVADAGAFVTFQLPIYVATLIVAGADIREILILVVVVVPQMLVLSRPFGMFLELMRRAAGVQS
ncbi:MAG: L-alanine exporter AlaE [Pseudomonadota bacterium]